MIAKMKKVISSNKLDDVILSGITFIEDGIAEFLPITKYIYLEFGDSIIEILSSEQYSRIQIRIVNSVIHEPEFEDVLAGYCSIANIVLMNPIERQGVNSISFINLVEEDTFAECDVFEIVLSNGQILFFDPTFFGNNIGGTEQKEFWLASRDEDVEYRVTELILNIPSA